MAVRLRSLSVALLVAASLQPLAWAESPAEAQSVGRRLAEIPELSTFVSLLQRNTTLFQQLDKNMRGRYTVFAPSNAAFAALGDDALQLLMAPANEDRREEVLAHHVSNTSADSFRLTTARAMGMRSGRYTRLSEGRVDAAKLIRRDLLASNGIIHVIDEVLTPPSRDLFQQLEADGRFTIFTRAIKQSRLTKVFQNTHQRYTAFAPTDAAFEALGQETLAALFRPEQEELLRDVVKHHIADGIWTADKTMGHRRLGSEGAYVVSQHGQVIDVEIERAATGTARQVRVEGVAVLEADRPVENGFLHVLDRVMVPTRDNLVQVLEKAGRFSTFLALLERAGLKHRLVDCGQATVFAPSDEVLNSPELAPVVAKLMGPGMEEAARALASRHIVGGAVHRTRQMVPYDRLGSFHGATLIMTRTGSDRRINEVPIVTCDLEAYNGVIHELRGVIADTLEPLEPERNRMAALRYVRASLKRGQELYRSGDYRAAVSYLASRGYRFVEEYGETGVNHRRVQALRRAVKDDDRVYNFAEKAWRLRNALGSIQRGLENETPRLEDELQRDEGQVK